MLLSALPALTPEQLALATGTNGAQKGGAGRPPRFINGADDPHKPQPMSEHVVLQGAGLIILLGMAATGGFWMSWMVD